MVRAISLAVGDAVELFEAVGDDAAKKARRRTIVAIDAGDIDAAARWSAVELLLHGTTALVPPPKPPPYRP